jgi:uncharacterized protein YqiB (DUF1249 family)
VTDYYHPSICLLLYVMDVKEFDQCGCDTSPLSNLQVLEHGNPNTLDVTVRLDRLLSVWKDSSLDRRLYHRAHELFMARIDFVQRETNVKLIC